MRPRPWHLLAGAASLAVVLVVSACGVGISNGWPPLLTGLHRTTQPQVTTLYPQTPVSAAVTTHQPQALVRASIDTSTSGSSSAAPVTSVVGLGDSVLSPQRCNCEGLLSDYTQYVSTAVGQPVQSVNLGVDGATTSSLLDDLNYNEQTREAVRQAGLLVLVIGANDVAGAECDTLACLEDPLAQTLNRVDQILETVRELNAGRAHQLLVLTYWNASVDGEVARSTQSEQEIRLFHQASALLNQGLTRSAVSAGATAVGLYDPFIRQTGGDPTGLLAADGDHPNAAGAQVIADALWHNTEQSGLR